METYKYSSELYPKEVIIKTAYSLTDDFYVHLDKCDGNYTIEARSKNGKNSENEFKDRLDNEIISQLVHFTVSEKTSEVRRLLMGRAFASSLIEKNTHFPEYESEYTVSAEQILKDWFDENGRE